MRWSLWSLLAALTLVAPAYGQQVMEPSYSHENPAAAEGIQQVGYFNNALSDCGAPSCEAPACSDNTCCDEKVMCAPKCRTFYGMVELAILEPQIGAFSIGGTQITPDFGNEISPRITLGVENSEGLGGRIRYWNFDHDAGAIDPGGTGFTINQSIVAQTLDFETTQSVEFRKWQLQAFGGFRYANMKYSIGFGTPIVGLSGDLDVKFEGLGPTIGANVLRPLGTGKFSLYGGGRGSLIFGDTRLGGTGVVGALVNPANIRVDEHSLQIFEINMGVQYGHGPLFARVGYEAQVWDMGLPLINFDLGFSGPVFAIGFIR